MSPTPLRSQRKAARGGSPGGWRAARPIEYSLLAPFDIYNAFSADPSPVKQRMARSIRGTVGTCSAD
jgi:hypothetical protein